MAKTEFTSDELGRMLFVEIIKHPTGGPEDGRVEFHGFYTMEALMRARRTRYIADMLKLGDGTAKGSDLLRFLAMVFDENECFELAEPLRR